MSKNKSGFLDKSKRRCRVCGCTDDNCKGCIERTGSPCYWVKHNLCSACAATPVDNASASPTKSSDHGGKL